MDPAGEPALNPDPVAGWKPLYFALLASVLAHALVLGVPVQLADLIAMRPPPLELLRLPSIAQNREQAEPELAPAPAPPPQHHSKAQAAKPAAEREVLTIPTPPEANVRPSAPSPPSPPLPKASVSAAVEPGASSPPPTAADNGRLVEGYKQALAEYIGRQRSYPRLAQMRGWEGTVLLRLRLEPDGRLLEALLERSSGHELLDSQALQMARRLTTWPPPPDALKEREINVLVPVTFRLQKQP
jgi:protein TonB